VVGWRGEEEEREREEELMVEEACEMIESEMMIGVCVNIVSVW
jgi:hypothetical protein